METKIIINWTSLFLAIIGIIGSLFGFFLVRMVRGYDIQIKELYHNTKDIPAIKEAIDWIKEELRNKKELR